MISVARFVGAACGFFIGLRSEILALLLQFGEINLNVIMHQDIFCYTF
jgi:hypothetical protein